MKNTAGTKMQYRPALHDTAQVLQEHNDSVKVQVVLRGPR